MSLQARPAATEPASAAPRFLPSPIALLAIAMGGIVLAITVSKGVQDPDYFWHVATGRLIAQTGQVPSTDPFTFTWAGKPWTPSEWLSELLIYWLVAGIGRASAVVAFGMVAAAIVGVEAITLTLLRVRPLAFLVSVALAMLAVLPYVTLRPQAESWLLMGVLVLVLTMLRAEHPGRSLWLIPLFALWANLHGLYIVGIAVVIVYLGFTVLGRTLMSSRWRWMVGTTAGVVAASMLTPAGPAGILYPFRYLQPNTWGLRNIPEWQSPSFHEPAQWAFLLLIVLVGLVGNRRRPGWLTALAWLGIVMGLVSERNIPVAAVLSTPSLALGIEQRLTPLPHGADAVVGRRVLELGAALVIGLGSVLLVVPGHLGPAIDKQIAAGFPVNGVAILQRTDPAARVFAEYGWGGYVTEEMYATGGKVFVDGRSDMFSEQILDDYSRIRAADPGWAGLLASYGGADAILLQPSAPLARGPATDAGWCEAYRDQVEVLYLRTCPGV